MISKDWIRLDGLVRWADDAIGDFGGPPKSSKFVLGVLCAYVETDQLSACDGGGRLQSRRVRLMKLHA